MKCYTFSSGRVSEGIAVHEDSNLGLVVSLGEEGRGRRYEKVGLFRKNPAEVKDGRIYEAHPVKVTINRGTDKEKSFYVLAKPNNGSERVLVRINVGNWDDGLVIMSSGDVIRWDDSPVIMYPGDVIRVINPEGGYKTNPYALFYNSEKGLQCMPFEDYENVSAVESEDAEVEFL